MRQEAIRDIRERCAAIRDLLLVGSGSDQIDSVIRTTTDIIEYLIDKVESQNVKIAVRDEVIKNLEGQLDEADIHCRNLQAIVDDCNR